MLRLCLLWYVCIEYGNNISITFHSYLLSRVTNSLKRHSYNITCFDTITNFK